MATSNALLFGIQPPQTPPAASHDLSLMSAERKVEAPLTPPAIADPHPHPLLITTQTAAPPTPAPSPRPGSPSHRPAWLDHDQLVRMTAVQAYDDAPVPLSAFIAYVTAHFSHLDGASRRAFLSSLLPLFSANDLLHTSQLITPLLKRDFLTDLPAELSLHILSFVDDARDLVRASQVCQSWRRLVGDEQTWKEMCKRHRFAPGMVRPGSIMPSASRNASPLPQRYATQAQSERLPDADELLVNAEPAPQQSGSGLASGPDEVAWALAGLGIGQNSAATSAASRFDSPAIPARFAPPLQPIASTPTNGPPSPTLLRTAGISPRRARYSLPSSAATSPEIPLVPHPGQRNQFGTVLATGESAASAHDPAFSYKMHFKRAYLTESNWLRGPGRLLSTQASSDDGVVTSLGFDAEWIIVGMATSKVHVFDAETGGYVRTLAGHDLGVWCLTLVSRGGVRLGPNGRPVVPDETGEAEWIEVEETEEDMAGEDATAAAEPQSATSDGSMPIPMASSAAGLGLGFAPGSHSGRGRGQAASYSHSATSSPRPRPSMRERRSSFHASSSTAREPSHQDDHLPPDWASGLGVGDAQQASLCGTARGWGQPGAVVVSGGCDRDVRVWDVATGICRFVLHGHTSTIRCLKVLDGRPIAVSGSRDASLRVWDIERGTLKHVLVGHQHSVRCLEVSGNKVVSGSYDTTCRLWDVDTGECLFVFRGHFHQIYAVAFDGQRVATGSLDSTVRIWSARTGDCLALLQGHTSLVGQLQLTDSVLVTGGSDGRVIVFSLSTLECVHRLCAHDNSVTCLQWSPKFLVTGGNDGRVKLFDSVTGAFIRLLAPPCEAVWRVLFTHNRCVIVCKRDGRTVMDVIDFSPL